MTSTRTRPPAPAPYAELVGRTRRLVERWVPPGSTVAVLSRGDPALVTFRDRVGWHLPCYDDGRYVGYHPADGSEAVAAVESVRARGAGYLVVPETSSWWLDHYEGLRDHLTTTGSVLADEPGTGTVFALTPAAADPRGTAVAADLAEIAGLLLPAGAWLAVLGDDVVARLLGERFRVVSLPLPAARPAALRGTEFVVLPCAHYPWFASRDDLRQELDRTGRLVTWQQHVGALFELGGPATT